MEVCTLLQRAYRAVRFYPPDHPLAGEALRRLEAAFAAALAEREPLRLLVTESGLHYDEEEVFTSEDLREGIPFLLFRDGVRSISFLPGLTREEILALVEVLVRAQEVDKAEHDVVTMLWERDFDHLDYFVVDPLLEGEAEGEEEVHRLAEHVREQVRGGGSQAITQSLLPDTQIAAGPHRSEGVARIGSLVQRAELAEIESTLERERDVLEEFGIVLIEVVAVGQDETEVRQAVASLRDLTQSYLEWGEFRQLAVLVRHLAEARGEVGGRRALIDPVLHALADVDLLRKAVFSLDGPEGSRREETEEFLLTMREWTYPLLVDLLVEAGGKHSRRCLLNVLTAEEGVPVRLVLPRLRDPRWYVVRNMVYLLGRLKDPAAGPSLEPLIDHADDRVRKEVIRALGAVSGAESAETIARALDDPSSAVRIAAARQLGALQGETALPRLLRQVAARDFAGRPEAEVDAFLDALGRLGSDEAIPILDDLWVGRSFFRSKPMHVRLFALRALGEIASARARESLARASRDGNETIRQQARRSAWEAERVAGQA